MRSSLLVAYRRPGAAPVGRSPTFAVSAPRTTAQVSTPTDPTSAWARTATATPPATAPRPGSREPAGWAGGSTLGSAEVPGAGACVLIPRGCLPTVPPSRRQGGMTSYAQCMTDVDLGDLRTLVLVAETGSIGKAAQRLGHSQPTISRRMAALERRLRVPLLDRSKLGTSLTPTGQVVVDWAAKLIATAEEFVRSVDLLREEPAGAVLRVAVSMTIAEHHALRWAGTLSSRLPAASVSFLVHNSTQVADLVESGDADLGFVESPTVRRSLRRRRVGWDSLVVAVTPDHPWSASGRPVTPAELAAAPLLVREEGSGTRETLEQALRRHGLRLVPGLEMASNTALKSAALAGMGPVVLSEMAVTGEVSAGRLVTVPVPELSLRRPLTGVWRKERQLPAVAAALLSVAGEG